MEDPPLPANPPVDCFFVYPTVSEQRSTNASKNKDERADRHRALPGARFSERCRIYAPVYRQLTIASIFTGTPQQREEGGKLAYADVREAWRSYLANDNRGRGVVLVGHSQGTRMLRQLLREEIDPNAGGATATGLGDPPREQRAREKGPARRRRLRQHPRYALAPARSAA